MHAPRAFSRDSGAGERTWRRRVAPGGVLRQAGRAAHQLLRGPDEPGVVRAAVAAQVEGVHARVAEHRGRFRVGHVQRARGHPGGEQVPDDQGGGVGIG